jgi:hypothetical protein
MIYKSNEWCNKNESAAAICWTLHTTLWYTGQIRIHIQYAETHPIISLSFPHPPQLVILADARRGAKFCTRYCAATHAISAGRREVGGTRLTCIRNTWIAPNISDMYSSSKPVYASPKREVHDSLILSRHFPYFLQDISKQMDSRSIVSGLYSGGAKFESGPSCQLPWVSPGCPLYLKANDGMVP